MRGGPVFGGPAPLVGRTAMSTRGAFVGGAAAALVAALITTGARATPFDDCQNSRDPELKLRACTYVIENKSAPGRARALAHTSRANVLRGRKQYDDALGDYARAIELNPELPPAFNGRGWTFVLKGEFERAIADISRAIELNPQRAGSYSDRGVAYRNLRQTDRAFADFGEALKRNPKLLPALIHRGQMNLAARKFDLALEDFGRAIEVDPKNSSLYALRAEAYGMRGLFRLSIGVEDRAGSRSDFANALSDCDKALELNPQDWKAYYLRGARRWSSNTDLAISDLTRSIEINPKYGMSYYLRGKIYLNLSDKARAMADFRAATPLLATQNAGLNKMAEHIIRLLELP
jgi:tetratricopeptide (TPR) repeat protein